jgi:hypothetical protein
MYIYKQKHKTMNKEFKKMQKIAGLITESQINENESVSELNDDRYTEIDGFVDNTSVSNFIDAVEAIQIQLEEKGVDAPEMYQYLVTIMLNQA